MLVAPLEQQRSGYEGFDRVIRFEDYLIASRFVGVCVLHCKVRTILPSEPLSAIAARVRLLRFVWFFGGGEAAYPRRIAYALDLQAESRRSGISWMLTSATTHSVACEHSSRLQ